MGGRGRKDRRGKAEARAAVQRGLDSRMCEIVRGSLYREHRGGSYCDMRYKCVRQVWPIYKQARDVFQCLL